MFIKKCVKNEKKKKRKEIEVFCKKKMVFRLFIFVLKAILLILFCVLLLFRKFWFELNDNLALWSFDIHNVINPENKRRYEEFKKKPNGVMVFTHSTMVDFMLLCREFHDIPSFLALRETCIFPFNYLIHEINGILFSKGEGVTQKIIEYIKNRKSGEPVLCIAPTGGYSKEEQNELCDFRNGAFVEKTHILPVIIKFNHYIPWMKGESFIYHAYRLLTTQDKLYTIKVLDEMSPNEDESMEDFKQRVKGKMEEAMRECNVEKENKTWFHDKYRGSNLLSVSSFLFLFPVFFALYMKNYKIAFYAFLIFLTSILYHSTGDSHYEIIDKISNHVLAIYLGTISLLQGIYMPPLIVLLEIFVYTGLQQLIAHRVKHGIEEEMDEDMRHFILVHIPFYIALSVLAIFYNSKKK